MSEHRRTFLTSARGWFRTATALTCRPSATLKAAPVAFVVLMGAGTDAFAKRLALVVGNAEYESVYSLKNAAKDAKDIASRLQGLDFEVTLLTDVDGEDFLAKLEEFAKKAEGDDVESTLFYFSGHAFQLDGTNYLVPSDASLDSAEAIKTQTWALDQIVARLESTDRQTLIFLDACRNNPLPESQRAKAGQGLAKLETGSGTYVAFATQPGNVTSDGAGENSPFTTALLEHIETPGISIADMMIRVRNDVQTATFRKQTPWDQSSLFEQFYFEPVVERTAELTESDYELIAALDPETRNRLLAALGNSGVNIEIEEIEDEDAETEVATLEGIGTNTTTLLIEDVDDDDDGIDLLVDTPKAVEPEKAKRPVVAVVVPTAVPNQSERIAKLNAELGNTGVASVDSSTTTTVISGTEVGTDSTPQVVTGTEVQSGSDSTVVAGSEVTDGAKPQVVTGTEVQSGSDATVVAGSEVTGTQTQVIAGTEVKPEGSDDHQLAGVIPDDPTIPPRSTVIEDESALVLAAISPSRAVDAITMPRQRVVGTELDRDSEEAAAIGITPVAPELEGKELAKAAQRELRRLGCYRMAIDGDWGRGSKLALARYYASRKTAADSLDPSNPLLTILQSEEKVVCATAVETKKKVSKGYKAAKAKKAAPQKVVKRKAAVKKKTAKKKVIKRTVSKRTASGKTKKKTVKRITTGVFR